MLQTIFGPIASLAGTWLEGKVSKSKAESEVKVARAKAEAKAVLTCCFLPWTQEYVKEGFIFLDQHTPNWFHNMLYIVIGSSFGYRFGKQGLQIMNKRSSK